MKYGAYAISVGFFFDSGYTYANQPIYVIPSESIFRIKQIGNNFKWLKV